ncbi:MAG TPA: branched-chain amino acid ABC transporter ATP-binding protein/permease [Burkholderiaceae bacterium]|nr:branched-chain amino acid ABC transporter ATP-binding protein/permease [Burkholderiaceae bacterium]
MIDRRIALGIVVAVLALVPLVAPPFYVTLFNYIGLFSLAALGLVLLTGVAGQTSFGQAAFVGLGAYASAVLCLQFGWSPWLTLPAALIATAAVAYVLGFVTLRMRGHFLPLGTLAWGISLFYLFGTLPTLGGFTGLTGLPPIEVFGFALTDARAIYVLTWIVALLALWATANLLDSRLGRVIRALKGRASMVEAFGVDPAQLRIVVFVYAALLAAVSGWLYAHMQRFVNPTPFGIGAGIEYLFMAVVGGAGNVWGAVIGATLITVLKEVLQDVLPGLLGRSGQFESIVFGVLMIVLLQRTGDGVWPVLQRLLRPRPRVARDGGGAEAAAAPTAVAAVSGPVLSVRSARKQFGGLVAVKDVSFSLGAGEILGLIGPNGAGKSTMFNLITGFLDLTAGDIEIGGRNIRGLSAFGISRLGVARSFQHVKLVPQMSVLDNVAIGSTRRGRRGLVPACLRLDRREEAHLLREAAQQVRRVGLAEHVDDPAGGLALGKQRIVEIARALCAHPRILLLDEPAAGLRLQEKQALAALLRELRRDGISILLVEHDMDFVMGLTDRLVVMEFGSKLAEGRPEEVQRDPAVRQAYLGGIG